MKWQNKVKNSTPLDWTFKSNWNWAKNIRFECENLTILEDKFYLIGCEMTDESEELNGEFNSSRLKIEIQLKLEQKYRFESENLESFIILGEKIPLLRCEMTE